MNVTPLYAQTTQPTSRPTAKRIKPTHKLAKKPSKTAKKPTHKGKKPSKKVDCKGRMRYGEFCLGRVIGPRFSKQILRCPHCGKDVHVKRLDKPWKPAKYDSDLRPYFGHYRQKDRIWVCRYCGYASYGKDFFKPYRKRSMTDALRAVKRPYSSYKDIPASYKYRAANASYVARGRDARFFAELLLRAMWAAREEKETTSIRSFRKAAIMAMRLAAKRKLVPFTERPTYYLQLGDLLRQDGRWAESRYWMEQAYLAMQEIRKAKKKAKLGRFVGRWILQIQQYIAKKNKAVFLLDAPSKRK